MSNKAKIAIVRGKYLNNFEMQNYTPLAKKYRLTAFASWFPIHANIGFPVRKLASPMDLPNFPYKLPVLNRLMVDAMYLVGLEKALKGYGLVCARETYFHFTQQALNAKKQGRAKKVLVTCSETIPHNHEGIRGRKQFKQRVIREADHFHCLTEKAKDCLISEGANPRKISVIGYGIDIDRFRPKDSISGIRRIQNDRKNGMKILFVGRLEEQKGIRELLPVFQKLIKKFPQLKLQIIGQGPQESLINKTISTDSMNRFIEAKSNVAYQETPKIYQDADIFVLPSKPTKHWEEYYGMALLEAMACGLPVVTTNCGAIPEVVGKAAMIVPYGKPKNLYQALKRLVENRKLRWAYGLKALKHAQAHFNCQKQAGKIGKMWERLLTS